MSISRFFEVVPDKLYRGGAPSPDDVDMLKNTWGVNLIVSLDEKAGKKISDRCKKLGIEQLMLPVYGDEEDTTINELDKVGITSLIKNKVTFVHCLHGKDRTGMFVARFRTENGWTAEKAVNEASKFGFGIGVDDGPVEAYLQLINNGPDAEEPVTIEEVRQLYDGKDFCSCGMMMDNQSDTCSNCNKTDKVIFLSGRDDAVGDTRKNSLITFQNPADTIGVSDLWYPGGDAMTTAATMDKNLRRGIVSELFVRVGELSNSQITQKISETDKKNTETLIEYLDKFGNLIDILIENQLSGFIELFKTNQGITYDLIKEMDLEKYFKFFGKNLKKNVWRLVGDKYVDIADDVDKNKAKKEHTGTDVDDQKKTLFDLCLERLSKFSNDTNFGPMQKSFEDAVKKLVDLIIEFADYLENKLDSEDMQKHVTDLMEAIHKQSENVKSIIKKRLIYSLNKDVLGKDRPYTNEKANTSVLKDIILETEQEEKEAGK